MEPTRRYFISNILYTLRIIRNSISAISNRDTITVVWDLFIYLEWIKQETMVT